MHRYSKNPWRRAYLICLSGVSTVNSINAEFMLHYMVSSSTRQRYLLLPSPNIDITRKFIPLYDRIL